MQQRPRGINGGLLGYSSGADKIMVRLLTSLARLPVRSLVPFPHPACFQVTRRDIVRVSPSNAYGRALRQLCGGVVEERCEDELRTLRLRRASGLPAQEVSSAKLFPCKQRTDSLADLLARHRSQIRGSSETFYAIQTTTMQLSLQKRQKNHERDSRPFVMVAKGATSDHTSRVR